MPAIDKQTYKPSATFSESTAAITPDFRAKVAADSIAPCKEEKLVAAGFLVLIGGIAFSWVGGLMVYGFGQLVDDTQAIRQNIGR